MTEIVEIENVDVITIDEGEVVVVTTPDTVVEYITEGIQGPPGASGYEQLALQLTSPLTTSETGLLDSIAGSLYQSVKWLVTVKDVVTDDRSMFELNATHDGTTIWYDTVGAVGADLDVTVAVVWDTGYLKLQITNNETNNINATATRIGVAAVA